MPTSDTDRPLHHLWQIPLLLLALSLLGVASWLFFNPPAGLTFEKKIGTARDYLAYERPEAAIEQLSRLLATEKLQEPREAEVHLALAEAIDAARKLKRSDVPANYLRIIEHTQIALAKGVKPTGEIHRRLGESFEALASPVEALSHYRQAIAMDSSRSLRLQRLIVGLQMTQGEPLAASAALDEYLADEDLTDAERCWAFSEKAQLLIGQEDYLAARELLRQASRLDTDRLVQGQINYRLGYCAWKLGTSDDAQKLLRIARDQFTPRHPLDADAAYVLGRIEQEKNRPAEAEAMFDVVLAQHSQAEVAPSARIGRAVCQILQGKDEPALTDLRELVQQLLPAPRKTSFRDDVIAALQQASQTLTARRNFQAAITLLEHERSLGAEPGIGLLGRLATAYEARADQLEKTIPDATGTEKLRRIQRVRELRATCGQAFIDYTYGLVRAQDPGYAEMLWRAIGQFEKAENVAAAASALELFIAERKDDPTSADALLRLAQIHHASKDFDRAADACRRAGETFASQPSAARAAILFSHVCRTEGIDAAQAEAALHRVLESGLGGRDESLAADVQAELGELYYHLGRWEKACSTLETLLARQSSDPRQSRWMFELADSYRRDAIETDTRVADAHGAADAANALTAKRQRLAKAKALFDQVVDLYQTAPPADQTIAEQLKRSHFLRADCAYELGEFEEAIALYESAASEYADDASALAARVQIVNAYCAMGNIEQARISNERATLLLRRLPDSALTDGSLVISKSSWEQWLRWTSSQAWQEETKRKRGQ